MLEPLDNPVGTERNGQCKERRQFTPLVDFESRSSLLDLADTELFRIAIRTSPNCIKTR